MNKITVIGRLTREVELKQTANKISYVRFTVASKSKQRDEKGEQITDFFNCIAWRGTADVLAKYCKKGDVVGLSGSMASKSKKGEDGQTSVVWELNVDDLDLLGNKADNKTVKNGGIDDSRGDDNLPF